jgi:esterase/lipase superfamily enzyme
MHAEELSAVIANSWNDIASGLGERRAEFESRLVPLLRQLDAAPEDGGEVIDAVLALFAEFPFAMTMLRMAMNLRIASQAKGTVPQMMPAAPKERYSMVPVFYATDRDVISPAEAPTSYGAGRGELSLGVARVSIPDDHRMGKIERPRIWKLEFRQNPAKHVVVWNLEPLSEEAFAARAKTALDGSATKEILLFVHGYNVTFKEAVERTAQLAFDLHFEGIPVLYSWPSEGSVPRYTVDENNVTWSRPRFVSFLRFLREQLGADAIHIVAHSMGNRLVSETLAAAPVAKAAQLRQLVLAAPDIDAATFKDLAAVFVGKAERVTLYASSGDKALMASKAVHGYPRAGESGVNLVVVDAVDTIDASAVDTSLLGHSYYGDNRSVVADLFDLIRRGSAPTDRFGLKPMKRYGLPYWLFQP